MKKIGLVFLSDAKRLSSNVVAIVIIMGLSIIPALYAWFNILLGSVWRGCNFTYAYIGLFGRCGI